MWHVRLLKHPLDDSSRWQWHGNCPALLLQEGDALCCPLPYHNDNRVKTVCLMLEEVLSRDGWHPTLAICYKIRLRIYVTDQCRQSTLAILKNGNVDCRHWSVKVGDLILSTSARDGHDAEAVYAGSTMSCGLSRPNPPNLMGRAARAQPVSSDLMLQVAWAAMHRALLKHTNCEQPHHGADRNMCTNLGTERQLLSRQKAAWASIDLRRFTICSKTSALSWRDESMPSQEVGAPSNSRCDRSMTLGSHPSGLSHIYWDLAQDQFCLTWVLSLQRLCGWCWRVLAMRLHRGTICSVEQWSIWLFGQRPWSIIIYYYNN